MARGNRIVPPASFADPVTQAVAHQADEGALAQAVSAGVIDALARGDLGAAREDLARSVTLLEDIAREGLSDPTAWIPSGMVLGAARSLLAADDATLESARRIYLADQLLAAARREGANVGPLLARPASLDGSLWDEDEPSILPLRHDVVVGPFGDDYAPDPRRAWARMRQWASTPADDIEAWQASARMLMEMAGRDVSVPLAAERVDDWLRRFGSSPHFQGARLRLVRAPRSHAQVRVEIALCLGGPAHTWLAATVNTTELVPAPEHHRGGIDAEARQRARDAAARMGLPRDLLDPGTPVESDRVIPVDEMVHDLPPEDEQDRRRFVFPGSPAPGSAVDALLGPRRSCSHVHADWDEIGDEMWLMCPDCRQAPAAARIPRHRLPVGAPGRMDPDFEADRDYPLRERARRLIATGTDPGPLTMEALLQEPRTSTAPGDFAYRAPVVRPASRPRGLL